jgi:hypothetical protein
MQWYVKSCFLLLWLAETFSTKSYSWAIGTAIGKGELRFGTVVDFRGNTSLCVFSSSTSSQHFIVATTIIDISILFSSVYALLCSAWRHWGCVTSKIFANMKKSFEDPSELDGYGDLKEEDQERVTKAFEEGKVADEDIPDSAKDADGAAGGDDEEEEEKPKKKRAPAKKKGEDASGEAKPKRARATKVKINNIYSR